ncbi:MAG: hypothetical protein KAW14_01945 [Candidatus Aegiribacteria sp.]|nr:hypothetical protein [Candidatus Aegiribacteria sp.]
MLKLCIPVLLLTPFCLADSAVMYEFPDGRTVAMTSNGDISMAAESVSIIPSGGMFGSYDDGRGWLPLMEVRCMFELVNNSGEEQYITVGFPFDAKYGDSYSAMDDSMLIEMLAMASQDEDRPPWQELNPTCGTDALEDLPEDLEFSTFINGEEAPVYYRRCASCLDEELVWRPVVAVWKMKFEPYETVILENTYNTSWDYLGVGPWSEFEVNYILISGSTWSGPIGDAEITLEVPGELPMPVLSDSLSVYWDWAGGPIIDGRTVTWHYTDLEPSENLSFSVVIEMKYYCDDNISASSMFNAVVWTEDELLVSTAEYLRDVTTWELHFDTILMIRILEALPYALNGHIPPNDLNPNIFRTAGFDHELDLPAEHEAVLEVVETIRAQAERDIALVKDAGYLEFLPLFTEERHWNEQILSRYSSYPVKQRKFLDLLEHLESASEGEFIEDTVIRAFYGLTGWYFPDFSSGIQPISADSVTQYREMLENTV